MNLFKRVWYDNDGAVVVVVVEGALSTAISWSNSLCKCSCMERPGRVRRRLGDSDDIAAVAVAVGDIGDNDAIGEGAVAQLAA